MSFITRQFVFIPGNKIIPDEWNAELDQIYRFLSGEDAGQAVITQNSNNPTLIVENIRSGQVVMEFRKGNQALVQLLGTQQLKSLITVDAPIVVDSVTKVVGLNAQYLHGLTSAGFFANGKKVKSSFSVSAKGIAVGNKYIRFIVPAGTNMQLTQVKYKCPEVLAAAQIDLSLKKNGGNINTVSLISGNSYAATNALAVAVVENDIINLDVDFIDFGVGSPPVNILCRVEFIQDLIT